MLVEPCLKSGPPKGLFSQKVCSVKKSIWPKVCLAKKSVQPQVSSACNHTPPTPPHHLSLVTHTCPLTSFKTVLLDGIVTAIISALPAEPPIRRG